MEELFQILSASARLKKTKHPRPAAGAASNDDAITGAETPRRASSSLTSAVTTTDSSKFDDVKAAQIHREQVACFRRSLHIRVNKDDPTIPDPISAFSELTCPSEWWVEAAAAADGTSGGGFDRLLQNVLSNVEKGRWKEPTPIQMQALPCLLQRRDVIGAAPTGSGKSGAFLIPTILLAKAPEDQFYGLAQEDTKMASQMDKKSKKRHSNLPKATRKSPRALLIAPSLELAAQLHREVERLSLGMHFRACLLSKSNAHQVASGEVGGPEGLHLLVATPLRLLDSVEKGLDLDRVRILVLDEADRLLDAADGHPSNTSTVASAVGASGSSHSKTFLGQMDAILSKVPSTAIRALFSATVSPTVRSLSESILRNPVDIAIRATQPGGANPDIEQKLVFVGKEQGKLLAIRQLVARGELRPPVLVFCQSQERAQALFEELLYDRIHVDVLHAGRSRAARDQAVAKFRQGGTWVLIATDVVARGIDFRAVRMVINYDLPESGITYIHRIGRTGRAGRKGTALTLFTEVDFDHLRTIANIMKQSGCQVEEWMLTLRKRPRNDGPVRRSRRDIDTTPQYDRARRQKKQQIIRQSKVKKGKEQGGAKTND